MLKWRTVQHVASNQTQQVGDANGHLLGLARIPGIVFFPDASTGTSVVFSAYDFVLGVGGTASGYYGITFADGSELWVKYTGTLKTGATGKVAQMGTGIVVGGKGRYAGAQGEGAWEGEQTQTANLPGEGGLMTPGCPWAREGGAPQAPSADQRTWCPSGRWGRQGRLGSRAVPVRWEPAAR